MEKTFQALASLTRRKILVHLSGSELNAGEIAEKLKISKPSLSKHLEILLNAGLITSERRGQFIYYNLIPDSVANTLNSFLQKVCPVARSIKKNNKTAKRNKTDE